MASNHNVNVVVRARDKASKKFGKIGKSALSMGSIFKSVAVASGVGISIAGIFKGSKALINAASDAEETKSKFDAVFKEQGPAAEAFGNQLAGSVKRSKVEIQGYLASLQDTFVPLGFARDSARGMSQEMTKLAIDLASFNNKADGDVIRDLQSAIVGNHETVRKYGVIITQATLDQELLSMGFSGGAKNASEQMKAQARLNIIMKGTTDAQGDAVRTAGGFANTWKGLKAQLYDGAAAIGGFVLPALTKLLGGVGKLIDMSKPFVGKLVKPLIAGYTFLEVAGKNWKDSLRLALLGAGLGITSFALDTKHFFTVAIPEYLRWFKDNWRDIFTTMWNGTKTFAVNVGKNLKNLFTAIKDFAMGKGWNFKWTGLMDGFESTIKEVPNVMARQLTDGEKAMAEKIGELGGKIGAEFKEKLNVRLGLLDANTSGGKAGAAAGGSAGSSVAPVMGAAAGKAANKLAARESRFLTHRSGSRKDPQAKVVDKLAKLVVLMSKNNGLLKDQMRNQRTARAGGINLQLGSVI